MKLFAPPVFVGFALVVGLSVGSAEASPLPSTSPLAAAATDSRIAAADRHLEAGRNFYFQNNVEGARREFDAAVGELLAAPDAADRTRIERRLSEITDLIYRFDVEKLGSGQTDNTGASYEKAPIDEISRTTFAIDASLAPQVKLELGQTASGIPLELSDPVLGFVHFFSTDRGRRILLDGYRRSGQYRELIQRVLTEEKVPQELIYLAQAESGFMPRAVSNKQAVGMWQFIAGTGDRYDLVHTARFDERLDPEKATRAAARYLRDLHARYDDWYLAMAAYNCGEGNVDRAIERTGYADYWELLKRHALPKETSGYVPIIIAMTIMAKNPHDYGLDHIDVDPALDYENIQLTAATNLNLIADAARQPVSTIHDLNPAILGSVALAGFQIHVPKGSAQVTLAALESVPADNRQAWRLHHVQAGDTLTEIAAAYHTPAQRILDANRSSDLAAGDVLFIPASYQAESRASKPSLRGGKRSSGSYHSNKTGARSGSTGSHSARKSGWQRATHVSASRHITSQMLHRKAVVHTAGLSR